MARGSLDYLIADVRALTPQCPEFTDDEIAAALDARRIEVRYMPLVEHESIAPGGVVSLLIFTAPTGSWESPELTDGDYNVVTADAADLRNGRFEFSAEPELPVTLTGWTHDVAGAAGTLLLAASARTADGIDVSADSLSVKRSGRSKALRDAGYALLAQARPQSVESVRDDEVVS